MSVRGFQADLKAFSRKTGISLGNAVKRIAIEAHDDIVMRTPVDTGRARASWNVGFGEIDVSVQPEGNVDTSHNDSQRAKIAGIDARMKPQPIFITNNLPYIQALENGHSSQAPNGMVDLTMIRIETEIEAMLQEL
jgi:hypothetical protein